MKRMRLGLIGIIILLISSFKVLAKDLPAELKFVMPEMMFPITSNYTFIGLAFVDFNYSKYTWHHPNGDVANRNGLGTIQMAKWLIVMGLGITQTAK